MAAAVTPQAEALARLACEETGFGVVADKVRKNLFASEKIYKFIRPMKTVGVVQRLDDRKVIEIAEPFGVVAAIVPSTNPTSTAIYKILIAHQGPLPHRHQPASVGGPLHHARRRDDGARPPAPPACPDGAINWMQTVSLEGTQELMKARETAVILATGGMGLVRAAYSAGKPAYGVGPGNAPAYIERSADVAKAVRDIVTGKTFDNGLLCSSENSVVVDAPLAEEAKRLFVGEGRALPVRRRDGRAGEGAGHAAAPAQPGAGRQAGDLHRAAGGFQVPPGTRVLIAELDGRRPRLPALDRKAVPGALVLRRGGLAGGLRALQADPALRRHGPHDVDPLPERRRDPAVRAEETGLPDRRQFADHAGVDRADDRAGPVDDAGLRRLRRQHHVGQHLAAAPAEHQARGVRDHARGQPAAGARRIGERPGRCPKAPAPPKPPRGVGPRRWRCASTSSWRRADTGAPPAVRRRRRAASPAPAPPAAAPKRRRPPQAVVEKAADFVCEDDVRQAVRQGRKILVGDRTIITPAARDLAEQHRVFVQAGWPR